MANFSYLGAVKESALILWLNLFQVFYAYKCIWANCRKCSAAKCSYWTHKQFMMFNVPLIAWIKQFTTHIVSVEIKKIKTLLVLSVTLVSIVRCVSPVTRYNCTLLDLHLNVSHYRNTPVLTFRYIFEYTYYHQVDSIE